MQVLEVCVSVQFDELAHDAFTKQLDQRCSQHKAVVPDTHSARSHVSTFSYSFSSFCGHPIISRVTGLACTSVCFMYGL